MFGFLNPRPHSLEYRRAYARLCQHQRQFFGITSLPFHSFEAVFLYQLAADLQYFPKALMPYVRCCKLQRPSNLHLAADSAVGQCCSAFGMLLASIKLDDDVNDSQGFLKRVSRRLIRWKLRKEITQANQFFERLDPRFSRNVEQLIRDHHQQERHDVVIDIADYVQPTGHAFAYAFSQLATVMNSPTHVPILSTIGKHVGSALIAYDCAVDWHRDRAANEFNPLPDEVAVEEAIAFSLANLRAAERIIVQEISPVASSSHTLRRVQERLLNMQLTPARKCRQVALPVYSGVGSQDEKPTETGDQLPPDEVVNANEPVDIPNATPTKNNQKRNDSSCCGNPNCDGCCDSASCSCMTVDCCAQAGLFDACCGAIACGDCSC